LEGSPPGGTLDDGNRPLFERIDMNVNDNQPKRLVRTREDRVIGGVCGGLGRYFNVDPILFRIGAVALVFAGGAGVLLYLAALLLVPNEEEGAVPAVQLGEGRNRALVIVAVVAALVLGWVLLLGGGFLLGFVGIPLAVLVGTGVLVWWIVSGEGPSGDVGDVAKRAALGIGVLLLCVVIALGGAFAAAAGPDWVVPTIVIGAGAAVLVGAFLKPLRWLVLPAVMLGLSGGVVAAADVDLHGGIGDRDYRPASAADLKDKYKLGMGQLVVDLRHTQLPRGDVPLKLDLGIGEARLIVPDGVCVATAADVGAGNVHVDGHDNGGVDVNVDERPIAGTGTRVLLDAQVGLGEVRVHDATEEAAWDDERHDYGPFGRHHDRSDVSTSSTGTCT
jgi:phage shock protein PspC (stress-responsive transcriptional regulator)